MKKKKKNTVARERDSVLEASQIIVFYIVIPTMFLSEKKNERKEKLSIHFLTHLSAFFLSPIDEGKYSVQRPPDDNYSIYVTVLYMITLIVSTMPEASGLSFMQSQYYVKCANKFIDTLPVRAKNTCLIVLPASL